MKVTDKIFTVQLTEEEIKVIVNSIHACYKEINEELKESGLNDLDTYKINERAKPLRYLRNQFAGLVGIAFMGEDA